MVDRTDEKEKNTISAEALYKLYQRNRPAKTQPSSEFRVTDQIEPAGETISAENIYKHYQANRGSDAQSSVDAIMRNIGEQSIRSAVHQEEQPSASLTMPEIQSVENNPGSIGSIVDQSQADAPAANSPNIFKRWLLPGVAAMVLGIVLIPLLMKTGPDSTALQANYPTALTDHAAQTVAFIEAPENATFGFTDTTNSAQLAFFNGAIMTDLALLVDAEQNEKIQPLLRALVAAPESKQKNNEAYAQVQLIAASMSEAISDGKPTKEITEYSNKLHKLLEDGAVNSEQLDWFLAGRTVESIKLAAQYALESSDIEPLKSLLLFAKQVDLPAEKAPASDLLEQLFKTEISGTEEFVTASEIVETARDIKLLMQQ